MASVTVNFADALAPRILDAFAVTYGWTATILDAQGQEVSNPETRAQFTKRMIQRYVKNVVRDYEVQLALATAKANAEIAVGNEVVLT
jgi:hypothetical protein